MEVCYDAVICREYAIMIECFYKRCASIPVVMYRCRLFLNFLSLSAFFDFIHMIECKKGSFARNVRRQSSFKNTPYSVENGSE